MTLRFPWILALLVAGISCTPTENPFEEDEDNGQVELDDFAAIHAHILEPKCANPACHDGTFEPDFRTVEGSYNTLVYHDVTKNDELGSYTYRVAPGDPSASWLINRIKYANDTLGRMPLYAEKLSQREINAISDWVADGAKDARGEAPDVPNAVPGFEWYVAFSGDVNWDDWNTNRIDENRTEWPFPFHTQASDTIRFLFNLVDDLTETPLLTDVTFYLADNPSYAGATEYTPEYFAGDFWTMVFPPNTFTVGDTNYFYLEFSDGTHLTKSPSATSPWWIIGNRSFYLN